MGKMDTLMSAIDVVIKLINLHASTDVLLSAGTSEFYIKKMFLSFLFASISTQLCLKNRNKAFMFMCLCMCLAVNRHHVQINSLITILEAFWRRGA